MVQARLEGYGVLPRRSRHAAVGDEYVEVVRAPARGAAASAAAPDLLERLERGRQAARRLMHARYESAQASREAEILRLLRIFGDSWLSDLYGRYVQVCAEKGWPVVTSRRFLAYVDVLRLKGRISKEVVSLGRGGVRARIRIVTLNANASRATLEVTPEAR